MIEPWLVVCSIGQLQAYIKYITSKSRKPMSSTTPSLSFVPRNATPELYNAV